MQRWSSDGLKYAGGKVEAAWSGELSQWLCYDDITIISINIVLELLSIIIIIIIHHAFKNYQPVVTQRLNSE